MKNNTASVDQIVGDFKQLPTESQLEIFATISRILVSNNPELIEMFADQLKEERRGDWWDELTEEDKQRLEQSVREGEEGEMVSHERVQEEARLWLKY